LSYHKKMASERTNPLRPFSSTVSVRINGS
jgi:hypothetical protein